VIILVTVITGLFVFLLHKRLIFTLFDKETARVYGVRTGIVEISFSLILTMVVLASMSSIGVTLLAAAIVAPAISARVLTDNFLKMTVLSTVIGAVIAFLGMYSSFYFDSASGATMVLFGAAAFGISSAFAFIRKSYHNHRHGTINHSHPHLHTERHRHKH